MTAIILISIGLFFIGIDVYVAGMMYPGYEYVNSIGEKIQQYISNYVLSDHLKIDVFPDVVGYILVFTGVMILLKYSQKYMKVLILAVVAGIVSVVIPILPFLVNGRMLTITELILFFLLVIFELYMEYIVIYTTVAISDDTANQATNKRLQFGWWITIFCRIFIAFLTFVGHIKIANMYKIALIIATVFYLYQMFQIVKYIGTRKPKKWTEKVLEREEKRQFEGRLR